MHPMRNNIGAFIHAANKSHVPAANAAGSREGTALEIGSTRSIVLSAITGATTGTPTTLSVTYKLQDSLDGTNFVDVADRDGDAVELVCGAASTAYEKDVDLQECCRAAATHVRWLETTAFTGGTTPTVLAAATMTRGPGQDLPQ